MAPPPADHSKSRPETPKEVRGLRPRTFTREAGVLKTPRESEAFARSSEEFQHEPVERRRILELEVVSTAGKLDVARVR